MQRLVAVLFRHGQPVAKPLRVRREDIGDERIDLPAVRFLFLERRVQDDADREQVVDLIDAAVLHLHLMVDRVNGFRPTLDGKCKAFGFQLLFERRDEGRDIGFALRFLGVQLMGDVLVSLVIQELQREILHLGFYLIQTQTVCHRRM